MCNDTVEIKRVVKLNYPLGFESYYHKHEFFHSLYVLSGSGIVKVMGENHTASQDDFFLISPGTFHLISSPIMSGFKTIEIKFTVHDDFLKQLVALPLQINSEGHLLRNLFESILNEASNREDCFIQIMSHQLSVILYKLIRASTDKVSYNMFELDDSISHPEYSQIKSTITYITDNLSNNLSVKNLASRINYNYSYFSARFKHFVGISPQKYINNQLLKRSNELIRYSDMNITQIAQYLGFSSLHYYSRFYKKNTGLSPQEFLEKNQKNIIVNVVDGNWT